MNPVPLNRNLCTCIVVQFSTGKIYSFLLQKSRPAVCRTEPHGCLVMMAYSPEVKRLGHGDNNSPLSNAENESCIPLPPYAVVVFKRSNFILLFYILGHAAGLNGEGGR
jgi:hypothetical protein